MSAPLPDLILYSRPGCHLCEDARLVVDALLVQRAEAGLPVPVLVRRNIEDNQGWHRRYLTTIPVLAVGDRELELATNPARVSGFLAATLDGASPE